MAKLYLYGTEDFFCTTPIFSRGYTGHEHLDMLGIINMNGRMYDPRLGMFMSADPVVQQPGNPLNYNRYSYVLNNPLKYTDPSGYEFVLNNWEEFLNVVDILWNTNPHGDYGGSWSSSGGINYFENNGEAYQAGVDYNNRTNGWGSTEYPNGAHVSTSFSLSTFNRRMSSNQRINPGGSFFNNLSNAYSASVSYNLVGNSSNGPDVPPGGWDTWGLSSNFNLAYKYWSENARLFAEGYNKHGNKSNEVSVLTNGVGNVLGTVENIKNSKAKSVADMGSFFFKSVGIGFGVISMAPDIRQYFNNSTVGNASILLIDILTFTPPGYVYGLVDFGATIYYGGTSMTDKIGAGIDNVVNTRGFVLIPGVSGRFIILTNPK